MNLYLSSDWKLKREFNKWRGDFNRKEGSKSNQEATTAAEAGVAGDEIRKGIKNLYDKSQSLSLSSFMFSSFYFNLNLKISYDTHPTQGLRKKREKVEDWDPNPIELPPR